jgi:small subunit ribosomal protein S18
MSGSSNNNEALKADSVNPTPHSQERVLSRVANRSAKKSFFLRRQTCPLCLPDAQEVTYKNPDLLSKFTSENGRILPRRILATCAAHQRKIKKSVKIARMASLLAF